MHVVTAERQVRHVRGFAATSVDAFGGGRIFFQIGLDRFDTGFAGDSLVLELQLHRVARRPGARRRQERFQPGRTDRGVELGQVRTEIGAVADDGGNPCS